MSVLFWISVSVVVYSYLLYPLLLLALEILQKQKHFKKEGITPGVSIVIAAYNEEKVIKQRIENCLSLDYPKELLEIIIASDGSDDQTGSIVRQYSSRNVILKDYKERRGKVNVLNETVPQAKHPIIIFSDANASFHPDAVRNIVRHFADEHIGAVCGRLYFVNSQDGETGELEGVYWRYETLLKKLEGKRGSLMGANGAIYAIRKELFEACPSDTIIEDFFIPMKILQRGFAVIYDPRAEAVEETAQKIVHEKERRIRIGAGDYQALFRLLPMLNPLRGFSALAFWSHKVLRWLSPFFLITALVSNLFLLDEKVYFILFILQGGFYLSALFGQALAWSGMSIKVFNLCYYFVSMNLALLLGFFRFLLGTQKAAWHRTQR